jgi:hypothetical protein
MNAKWKVCFGLSAISLGAILGGSVGGQVVGSMSAPVSTSSIPAGTPGGAPLGSINLREWSESNLASQAAGTPMLATPELEPPEALLPYFRGEVDAPKLPEPSTP